MTRGSGGLDTDLPIPAFPEMSLWELQFGNTSPLILKCTLHENRDSVLFTTPRTQNMYPEAQSRCPPTPPGDSMHQTLFTEGLGLPASGSWQNGKSCLQRVVVYHLLPFLLFILHMDFYSYSQ